MVVDGGLKGKGKIYMYLNSAEGKSSCFSQSFFMFNKKSEINVPQVF
jgi:hypothetical protein